MYCSNCGTEINKEMKLCPGCGGLTPSPDVFALLEKPLIRSVSHEELAQIIEQQEAQRFSSRLRRNIFVKIIIVLIKIIAFPIMLALYLLGLFISIAASLGSVVVGLMLLLSAIGFLIGLWHFFSMQDTTMLFLGLTNGGIFLVIGGIIFAIPTAILTAAQLLKSFIFGTKI